MTTPRTGGRTQLSNDTQTRLSGLLDGNLADRQLATGAAFEQFFTGQLSGTQIDLQDQLRKNRLARGLRGRATQAASDRLGNQFRASNRVAAAEFIGESLGRNFLPQLGQGFVQAADGRAGQFSSVQAVTGQQRASDLPAFQAFQTEISGLRAEGLQFGGASVNRRIDQALAANQGDRRAAFADIFGTASLGGLQGALDPQGLIESQRGIVGGSIREQIDRLQGGIGVRQEDLANFNFQPGQSLAILSGEEVTNPNLRITDDLLGRLGLRTKAEAGGFHNVLAGVSEQELAQRAADNLGFDFGGAEDVRARIVSGIEQRGNGTKEAINFLAFEGGSLADSAELLLNLTSSQFVGNRTTQEGLRTNIQSLRQLNAASEAAGQGIGNIDLLQQRGTELALAEQGPRVNRESARVTSPITGNSRTRFSEVLQAQAANTAEQERLRSDIAGINQFRTDLFSPTVPFFT